MYGFCIGKNGYSLYNNEATGKQECDDHPSSRDDSDDDIIEAVVPTSYPP